MRERGREKVKTNPWKCWQILTFCSWLWINAWSQRLHLVGDPVQLGPCLPKVSAPAKAPKQDSQNFTAFNLSSIRHLEKKQKQLVVCADRGCYRPRSLWVPGLRFRHRTEQASCLNVLQEKYMEISSGPPNSRHFPTTQVIWQEESDAASG